MSQTAFPLAIVDGAGLVYVFLFLGGRIRIKFLVSTDGLPTLEFLEVLEGRFIFDESHLIFSSGEEAPD